MTISQVIMCSLAVLGKSDSDSDYAACKTNAHEIIRLWAVSTRKLYLAYAEKNGITPKEFGEYELNDEFVYGEDFAPLASFYIASILSPKTERFRQIYDEIASELRITYGSDISPCVSKYSV